MVDSLARAVIPILLTVPFEISSRVIWAGIVIQFEKDLFALVFFLPYIQINVFIFKHSRWGKNSVGIDVCKYSELYMCWTLISWFYCCIDTPSDTLLNPSVSVCFQTDK